MQSTFRPLDLMSDDSESGTQNTWAADAAVV
jgi:hypothetical protein